MTNMMITQIGVGLAYLAAINLLTYLAFRHDKNAARAGARRTPEKTLLTMALMGGSLGAKRAQARFRHKTRKEPFRSLLNLICVLHAALVVYGLAWAAGIAPPPTFILSLLTA